MIFIILMMNIFNVQFDIFLAMFIGIFESFCYRNALELSRDRILDLETHECLLFLTNMPSSTFKISYLKLFHSFIDFISYLESQANLHIIEIISLNEETPNNSNTQKYEMAGIKDDVKKKTNEKEVSLNQEALLEEKNNNNQTKEIFIENNINF